ncbi:MAG TPA: prealbumin-like fold domain-containing protein [Jatrophihabitantaceae bacterium]
MQRRPGRLTWIAGPLATTVVWFLVAAPPAVAAATGEYAAWSTSGASGNWTGSGSVTAAGFPSATLTSTSTTLQTPTGASTFLGPGTPVGAIYGSSRNQSYLNVATAAGNAASVTTVTFPSPTPAAGWAFALGDVDADAVQISAVGTSGLPVLWTALGWQSAFNYCAATPKPGSCTGSGPFTDVPTWNPLTSTLTGSGTDTLGAAGWFQPSAALTSITFTFTRQIGNPIFQLWLAALSVPVTGQVDGIAPSSDIPEPGVQLDLLTPSGDPVPDPSGDPVTTTADDTGKFEFPAVADGDYVIEIKPPPGVENTGKDTVPITVDVSTGGATVPPGTFAVQAAARPTPTPSTSPPARPSTRPTPPASHPPASGPVLAATGSPILALVIGGGAALVGGLALTRLARRH